HDAFREMYAQARERQADGFFDEIIEIADKQVTDNVQVSANRNRVDARKFVVARMAPRKYGDQAMHEPTGGGNFQPRIAIMGSSDGEVQVATSVGCAVGTDRDSEKGSSNINDRGRTLHLRALGWQPQRNDTQAAGGPARRAAAGRRYPRPRAPLPI